MTKKYVGQQLPVVGPWIGKFGRVVDIMATPCQVDPEIWVLAFFQGLPTAMFSLFKPDPFDLTTTRFGSYHKKKSGRRFRWDERVTLPKPSKGGLTWQVFKVGQWAERLGWYMLIADVAFEWALNWSSMAYQWSGCKDPNASWGHLRSVHENMAANGIIWAGWSGATWHGKIMVDDYSIFPTTAMACTPYLKLEISRGEGLGRRADYIMFQVVDLHSNWRSDPMPVDMKHATGPQTLNMVWPDYAGFYTTPKYALYIESDGGFWQADITLGLNGDPGRGLTFDP